MDDITPEERAHINKLRSRMKGLMNEESYEDDRLFRRFLRARNFEISAAEKMLKKNLEWRKQNNMDAMDYAAPLVVDKHLPFSHFGIDKEGSPVRYCDFGSVDFRGILKCVKGEEITRYFTWKFEKDVRKMKDLSVKLGKAVEQFTYIFNMENFSLRMAIHKPTLEFMSSLAVIFEANYPERLKVAYMVNAPGYFSFFWAVLSPFLTGETNKKVKIFRKSDMSWKEQLLKSIDADVLPSFLGGNRTDPDGNPECRTFIKATEPVPEHYYSKSSSDFCIPSGAKKLIVDQNSKEEIILNIEHPASKIEYEIYIKNKEVMFSVLYKKDESTEAEELIPKQKIQTDNTSEDGVFVCDKKGIYILLFDNTYNSAHQKEIYYTTNIMPPNKQTSSVD